MTATADGPTFTIHDSSSAVPTRGRPHARRTATVRVSLPETAPGFMNEIAITVEAAAQMANARVKIDLTAPDGKSSSHFKETSSGLFFCKDQPKPCDATYNVVMTYDGSPGTDTITWKVTATATNSTFDGPNPPTPKMPTITTTLGPEDK